MTITAEKGAERVHKGKILIIVENLSVPFDRRVWRECNALREVGYQVSVISPMGIETDKKSRELIDGISIYRYKIIQADGSFISYFFEYFIAFIMSFWLALIVLFREGYDIIQICNPPDTLILAILPFKFLGKKVIFDQHDLCPEIYQTQKRVAEKKHPVVLVLLFCEKMTYLFSDTIVVVNKSCKKIAVGRGEKKTEDVFIVRNGPSLQDIGNAHPNRTLKHGKMYLLTYVGMMGPQEGIDILLRVIRNLVTVHKRTDFHVRIIGDGTVLYDMQKYATELGVTQMVTFTGHLNYEGVMEGIATADVCLCPDPKNTLSDKCSLVKAIEYMSQAKPFVAFDLEEVHSSAADSALYAVSNNEEDFADKVNYLLDNASLRISMGETGKERFISGLTWEHSKDQLYAAYEHAFTKARGRE